MAGCVAPLGEQKGKGLEVKLKLNRLTEEQSHILKLVVEEFYIALPEALKVHSLFATHILSETLHRYGIRTRVLPCRLWCSLPQTDKEFPGGFVNFYDTEKWNGHVVCLVGEWLVDAALYHLNPTFNFEVPKIVARRIALPEPGIYTRYRLNRTTEFVWYRLPPKAPAVTLAGYEEFIERYVAMLVSHVNVLLGIVEEPVPEEVVPDEQEIFEGQEAPQAELTEDETRRSSEDQEPGAELAGEVASDDVEVIGLDGAADTVDQELASVEESIVVAEAEAEAVLVTEAEVQATEAETV